MGVVSETGIAELTLGGGIGWLMRKYGLSSDNLLSKDVMTAGGRFLTASETQNQDLSTPSTLPASCAHYSQFLELCRLGSFAPSPTRESRYEYHHDEGHERQLSRL